MENLKDNRIGETQIMNNKLKATIIGYHNCMDIDVRFENGEIASHKTYARFINGNIRLPKYRMRIEYMEDYAILINPNTNFQILVDINDAKNLIKYTWRANNDGYAVNGKLKKMHRYIINAPKKMEVDHINGNKSDNRRCNLRLCTHSENQCNSGCQSNNTSGYKGVSWDKHNNKWRAKICINNKQIHLGLFTDKEEAAQEYNKASLKHHGRFANLNKLC